MTQFHPTAPFLDRAGKVSFGAMKTSSRAPGGATAVGSVRRPSAGGPARGEVRRNQPVVCDGSNESNRPFAGIRTRFLHRPSGFLSARRATSTTLWTLAAAGLEVLTGLALIVRLGAFSSVPTWTRRAEATG